MKKDEVKRETLDRMLGRVRCSRCGAIEVDSILINGYFCTLCAQHKIQQEAMRIQAEMRQIEIKERMEYKKFSVEEQRGINRRG
jgi:hypothetical protein